MRAPLTRRWHLASAAKSKEPGAPYNYRVDPLNSRQLAEFASHRFAFAAHFTNFCALSQKTRSFAHGWTLPKGGLSAKPMP